MRDSELRQYNRDWLQYERPQPMYDASINSFYDSFYQKNPVHSGNLDERFKDTFVDWLHNHELSTFKGLDAFRRVDVIQGCTQYIDDLYQRLGRDLRTLKNDYKYHWRLNKDIVYFDDHIDHALRSTELLVSMPFPFNGDEHPRMQEILDKCYNYSIPVHVDGAWISCIRDINFNFDHPAIQTIGISLSKGGLGGNRIGIRLARNTPDGAVTIMNEFNMNPQALMSMGIEYMNTFGTEYFWKKYESKYYRVCADFGLTPTKAIHLAKDKQGRPVGVRSLLRSAP
ncbi:hypothetical protein UFOVP247_84 [uncultured Caudovirales phage]|uniref:Uncharacterized protein n=1 Tax=uncultured Caudovirales phage TaxID=2100421 RepID=A0A6J7WTM7_9CAUD|nr:hypothetical protein UFOVP247_84 [uncultured Caudovirales phage]